MMHTLGGVVVKLANLLGTGQASLQPHPNLHLHLHHEEASWRFPQLARLPHTAR